MMRDRLVMLEKFMFEHLRPLRLFNNEFQGKANKEYSMLPDKIS